MRLLVYIPWLGSIAIEIALVFLIFRRGAHKRFSFFCAYILFDLAREIGFPAATALIKSPHLYSYLYWLSFPIEYALTFLIVVQVFAYIFRAHILDSPRPIQIFLLCVLFLFTLSALLVLFPGMPKGVATGLILALNRSIELFICGLLIFMWAYSARLGLSFQDHVWGIVFGLGIYSGISLIAAAISAAVGQACTGWISQLPHTAYFISTAIWTTYLFRPEPEHPPLSDEQIAEYQGVIETCKAALTAVRKAMR